MYHTYIVSDCDSTSVPYPVMEALRFRFPDEKFHGFVAVSNLDIMEAITLEYLLKHVLGLSLSASSSTVDNFGAETIHFISHHNHIVGT